MKKFVFNIILVLCIAGIAGCSKKNMKIDYEKVTTNTMIAKSDGKLQVAKVADFDKSYYKLAEFEEFAKNEINTYNKNAGDDKIKVNNIHLKDGQAKLVMVLSYSGMDSYSEFNKLPAAYFNGGVKDYPLDIPKNLISVNEKETINTNKVLQNNKYRVLVLYEPYDIVVDGRIVYYSKGAEPETTNKIKGSANGVTVVVYKP